MFGYFESAGGVPGNQYPADARRIKKRYFSSSDQLLSMSMGGEIYLPGYEAAWKIGRELGLQVAAHIVGTFGMRGEFDKLATAGAFGPDNFFIHMTGMSDFAWQKARDAGVAVSLAVPIEMNMAHGTPPIIKALHLGIRPSLSTDVECTLTADLFTQMRTAMALQRMFVNANKLGETSMPPTHGLRLSTTRDAIEWATLNGARDLRLDKKVGSLTPGKEADIIILDAEAINVAPLNHVPGAVVSLDGAQQRGNRHRRRPGAQVEGSDEERQPEPPAPRAGSTRATTCSRRPASRRTCSAHPESRGEPQMLFPTTIVGSFPQPDWLIDREKLAGRFPPRVRARELWRIPPQYLNEAQEDATLIAIRAQEEAGLDIVSDGEIRRESYSNRFATALDGVDLDNPGSALDRSGHPNPVPRIVGRIRRRHAVEVEDLNFLRAHTDRKIKITVPGPFTMLQQAQNDFYASEEEAAMDYAEAVNAEIKDLFAAGADVVQIDEPYMQARPEKARQYGLAALNRALQGVQGTTAVHICFGYAAIIHARPSGYSFLPELAQCSCRQVSIETAQSHLDCSVLQSLGDKQVMVGCIDLSDPQVESADTVVQRIERALPYIKPENVILAPDCGMKYLPRETAVGKLRAMVAGGADPARTPPLMP